MKTPFTTGQFFEVFERYNATVFPSQLIILCAGLVAISFLHSENALKNRIIGSILGFLWVWTGVVYHILFFTEINKAAFVFGGVFILQGVLFLLNTFSKAALEFSFEPRLNSFIGYFFILFGLIIYPAIGFYIEGTFIRTITLGLPCPTTILTFGFLILTTKDISKYLLIIPTLWSVVGISAALNFGVYQDFVMIVSAVAANLILIKRKTEASKL